MSYEQVRQTMDLLAETAAAAQAAERYEPWADHRFLTICGVLLETLDAQHYFNDVAVPFPFGRVREGLSERVAA